MDVVRARWNFVGLIVAGLREVECVCHPDEHDRDANWIIGKTI
jgi:hypothetical protein